MAQILGLNRLLTRLAGMKAKVGKPRITVYVGFTQRYAVYVHERTDTTHKGRGQAKFLETPAREKKDQITDVIRQAYMGFGGGGRTASGQFQKQAKAGDFKRALLLGGVFLQREAQLITPRDTGALAASAFTAAEEEYDQVAEQAFQRSEAKRKAG